jgi:hypothetical protein
MPSSNSTLIYMGLADKEPPTIRSKLNWQGIFGHFLKSGFMIYLEVFNGKKMWFLKKYHC